LELSPVALNPNAATARSSSLSRNPVAWSTFAGSPYANSDPVASFLEQPDNPQRQRGFRPKVAQRPANFQPIYGTALMNRDAPDWATKSEVS
jgi:hypothetical protein